ncbi:hypothetical protein [Saliphagus infecundisoli]|uniref:Uncharacterized protein n=1 Tax=Saliphagus infecundisoli TaxID=1849069 RepID=A0ABD5QGT6_9EURY|nr:hypothetical protein [Saliphagus infecundisoli]
MNRRTLLRAGTALPLAALAGCLGSIQDLRLSTPVTLRIENESDDNRNVVIVAHTVDDDRQTYDEAVSAPPEQSASVGHLSDEEQHLRVELVDESGEEPESGEVIASEETFIGADTRSVVVYVSTEDVRVEVNRRD